MPSVVLLGSWEPFEGLLKRLQTLDVRVHETRTERARDHVWMYAPHLVVAAGDAVVDGGTDLHDCLLTEPASKAIPLLLLRRGRCERNHSRLATLTPTLGERRLALVIARVAHELASGTVLLDFQPLKRRLSVVLRQVEQEDALLLCRHNSGAPRLSSPAPAPYPSYQAGGESMQSDPPEFDFEGTEEPTVNQPWLSELMAAREMAARNPPRATMPAPPPPLGSPEAAQATTQQTDKDDGPRDPGVSHRPPTDTSGAFPRSMLRSGVPTRPKHGVEIGRMPPPIIKKAR